MCISICHGLHYTLLLGAFSNTRHCVVPPPLCFTFLVCTANVSVLCPPSLPLPICVQAVEGRPNAKLSHQVEEALCRVSLGVQGNEGFSTDHLLLFIHDLVSDSVPQLSSSDEGR